MNPCQSLFESVAAEANQGRKCAVCLVVATKGSTPQSPGAAMLVRENMHTEGTLGGGCVEAEVRRRAFDLLADGDPQTLDFSFDRESASDDGVICGGWMKVAVLCVRSADDAQAFARAAEAIGARRPVVLTIPSRIEGRPVAYRFHAHVSPRLLIAGGGHVGLALARLASQLDFHITVIDDRADFANPERFPPPMESIAADIEAALRRLPVDPHTYVVIVTRGHRHDQAALSAVIDSPARYIGMIGSRRKVQLIFDALRAEGVSEECIARVHAPIGVPIGSVTVPEIAISIAAQLIAERRSTPEPLVEGPFEQAIPSTSAVMEELSQ